MSKTLSIEGLQIRGDTSTNFALKNPILKAREMAYETDTQRLKIGDGVTYWNNLAYFDDKYVLKKISSNTYSNLLAATNTNGDGADFIFGKFAPKNSNDIWSFKFVINASFVSSDDSITYTQRTECFISGHGNTVVSYANFNTVKNTSNRCYNTIVLYRPSVAGNVVYVGFCLYNQKNILVAGNERTVDIELLEADNCTFDMFDSVSNGDYGKYFTNGYSRSTYNAADNGLQETGDTNNYDRYLVNYDRKYAGANLYSYKLCMLDVNNKIQPLTTTSGTGTTKTVNTTPLQPEKMYFYNSTTTVNSGSVIGAGTLYEAMICQYGQYTFNASVTTYRRIYLCGDYDAKTNKFTLATKTSAGADSKTEFYRLVPVNSATVDLKSYFIKGRYYIYVGESYSTTNYFQLSPVHPMFYFDGENLVSAFATRADLEDMSMLDGEGVGF